MPHRPSLYKMVLWARLLAQQVMPLVQRQVQQMIATRPITQMRHVTMRRCHEQPRHSQLVT